jgi:hypothetical protein
MRRLRHGQRFGFLMAKLCVTGVLPIGGDFSRSPCHMLFFSFLDEKQRHNLQSALPLRYDPADTKQSCASTRKLGSVLLGQELPNQNQH